jgi:hypothetical protein
LLARFSSLVAIARGPLILVGLAIAILALLLNLFALVSGDPTAPTPVEVLRDVGILVALLGLTLLIPLGR